MHPDLKREVILDHNQNPRHYGKTDDTSYDNVVSNNISCIDKFELQIKMENDVIKDLIFFGEGCAISTSTTSIMTELLIGKTKEEAINIINNYIHMINEEDYDEDIIEEAIVFNEIYKQVNRKNCALLTWENVLEYLLKRT